MAIITNIIVKEVHDKVRGNQAKLHSALCKLVGKNTDSVNAGSLRVTVKRTVHHLKRLKHARNEERYKAYSNKDFRFPRKIEKRKTETLSKQENCSKHEGIIKHHQSHIASLKARYNSIGISAINQKIKRQTDIIQRLRNEIKCLKEENKQLQKKKAETFEAAVQCNTMKSYVSDLKVHIDKLEFELDENNNEEQHEDANEKNTCMKLKCQTDEKGKPYNDQIRQVYYMFLSRRIGLQHIKPIIEGVLSLVDVQIEKLPSVTTACKMVNELGSISRTQLESELCNSTALTMHRDATTKKGRHFYGVEYSNNNGQTYTAGIREVCDGKAETYLNTTNEILSDITPDTQNLINNTTCFMTDRSSTEGKTNRLFDNQKTVQCNSHQFKCAIHPLLQFAEVCQKEITKFETDIELDTSDGKTVTLLRFVSKLL